MGSFTVNTQTSFEADEKVNVLVVVDVQNDFDTGSLGSKEAHESVHNIIDKIVECGKTGHIILATKDTHYDDDYLDTNEGRHLPVKHTIQGTDGWQIVPGVQTALDAYNAVILTKETFGSKDLIDAVRFLVYRKCWKKITDGKGLTITLIGWCTDICVITNALLLKTTFPEAEIIVDSKCCAGVTQQAHEAALTVMKSCQITVI